MKSKLSGVYELNKVVDDSRFEGFALTKLPSILGRNSLDDDVTPGFLDAEENPEWEQPRLTSNWFPPKVVGRVSEFNDYPCVDMILPAFSQRAVDGLRPLLASNGELLPLDSDTKTRFVFFNILTISDALDRSRSKCNFWCDPPTTATTIDYFEFHRNKLIGLSIFRIREMPASVFVTDEFVGRVDFFGLKGFSFKKVWPLPVGVNWRIQKSKPDQEDRSLLTQQTLVIVFPFEGSIEQQRTIATFEDVVDHRLKVADLGQSYFGSYEGHDQDEYEYRMFFSAPNAESLYALLLDDIRGLSWPSPVKVYRRHGRIFDENVMVVMSIV